jgi:NADPH:quinone reductase-like Zn-dependent oxidoreductase
MKASVIDHYGGPEVLHLADVPNPIPGKGEVLVRVAAASVNPIDTMDRAGRTKDWRPLEFPAIIGWDLAGTVEAIGPGTKGLIVGDLVFGWAYHTYAELCTVNTDLLAKAPDGIDLADLAALPLVGATGSQMITTGAEIKGGQTILVSGANGAVGRSAVFTAKDHGAHVIAGVTTRRLVDAVGIGADEVVALDDPVALAALPAVDVVANCVRGKTGEYLLGKVKPGGVYVSVTGAPANAVTRGDVRVVAYVSRQNTDSYRYIASAVLAGRLTIPIERRLSLSEAAAAHAAVEKGGVGKILLLP